MEQFEEIKKILTSKFEVELYEASLACLKETNSKLRFNNFAYSLRELSRHFLHSLSPEARVKACSWYKTETDNDLPTRPQRIKYAIQGGISDETLTKLGFDTKELADQIRSVKKTIDELSKFTHINENVFDLPDDEVNERSNETLSTFKDFVTTIDLYRQELKSFLDGKIDDDMVGAVISTYFENIDHLAPHYSLEHSDVDDYNISEINDSEIIVDVKGNMHVILEYGSRQERREGDGLDIETSFPFETKIRYQIGDDFPTEDFEVDDFDADTSSWY